MDCLILEDQVLLADLLARDVASLPGVRVSGVAHSVEEGRRLCRRQPPDLLVVDLLLPDGDGLQVAETLLQLKPEARVLVLSAQCERLVCSRHLHDAIVAVVDKAQAIDTLHDLILSLVRSDAADVDSADPLSCLSARERAVLCLIGRGCPSEEIARRLGISLHTARTHRRNITAKLGIKGAELVLFASGHPQLKA
jgi:DNA-binding NarL/FixJ family response regulator